MEITTIVTISDLLVTSIEPFAHVEKAEKVFTQLIREYLEDPTSETRMLTEEEIAECVRKGDFANEAGTYQIIMETTTVDEEKE